MSQLKRTPLFPVYGKYRGRVVDFAGWELPVQFSGINDEHLAVRNRAGIFDVSHMGEVFARGPGALDFLQRASMNDASRLYPGKAQYAALLNEAGGIIDDIYIYCLKEREYLICVNASNADKDFAWLCSLAHPDCELKNESAQWAQIAVQGPKAVRIVERAAGGSLAEIKRYHIGRARVAGVDVLPARSGYTGEDGFELFTPAADAVKVWEALMDAGQDDGLLPCGLGARDTLRLEMGYPLHGHDIKEDTTPLEAGLDRFVALGKPEFVGKPALIRQKQEGLKKARAGMVMAEPGVPRDGHKIVAPHGEGRVTSGTKTPCLPSAIALGYLPAADAAAGTEVKIEIRGKLKKARVEPLPFYHPSK
ncbi:MAG TPA: glycine cleavage system aminomethyltransferase GcvT [bacterium]|nr:glycine cleavage system aminomethyltransferase GcvT [bacterium]